jgi:hypothetical protein
MSTQTQNLEELLMLKEITGVCPLIIFVNRNLSQKEHIPN